MKHLQMKCNQKDPDCTNPPAFRFTWPGRDEACICVVHARKMQDIINAMGLYVQMIPLTPEDYIRNDYRETLDGAKEREN